MHTVYYVMFPKEEAETPLEAMNHAQSELDNNSFAGEGGFFSNHKADWYVVGGRWASLLCERHDWAKRAEAEIEELKNRPEYLDEKGNTLSIRGTFYGSEELTKKQDELREKAELIWGKHRPKDYPVVYYDRWTDPHTGARTWHAQNDDCAELVTPELITYLQEYAEDVEVFFPEEYEERLIKDLKPEDYSGSHWLVVVDYHL
jgi:hypothetical protein